MAKHPHEDGGGPSFTVSLSPRQFWGLLGAVLVGYLVLVGLIYEGLRDNIKDAKDTSSRELQSLTDRVAHLEGTFQSAIAASAAVSDLLARAPNLEKTVSDTRDTVLLLKQASDQQTQQLRVLGETHDTRAAT